LTVRPAIVKSAMWKNFTSGTGPAKSFSMTSFA